MTEETQVTGILSTLRYVKPPHSLYGGPIAVRACKCGQLNCAECGDRCSIGTLQDVDIAAYAAHDDSTELAKTVDEISKRGQFVPDEEAEKEIEAMLTVPKRAREEEQVVTEAPKPKRPRSMRKEKKASELPDVLPGCEFTGFQELSREEGWAYKSWKKQPHHIRGFPVLTDEFQRKRISDMIRTMMEKKKDHPWLKLLQKAHVEGIDGWVDKLDMFKLFGITRNRAAHALMFSDPTAPYISCHRPQVLEERYRLTQTATKYRLNQERQLRVCPVHLEIYRQIITQ